MSKNKQAVSGNLINITMDAKKSTPVNTDGYKIYQEDDGYWCISFEGELLIRTNPSDKIIDDLINWKILPSRDDEQFNTAFESYLIRAAKLYVTKGLHKKKQDGRGKIDVPGIDDEF